MDAETTDDSAYAREVWRELRELGGRLGGGDPAWDRLVLYGGAAIGDGDAIAVLARGPVPLLREVMLALSRVIPARDDLAELAFRVIAEAEALDAEDLRLGVWAGLTPREAGWEVLSDEVRAACVSALVRAGKPASAVELLPFSQSLIADADRTALMLAWCSSRAFEHSADEYRLVAELPPEPRFEAMSSVLARGPLNPFVAHTWVRDADAAWRLAESEADHALADARIGALAVAAGAHEDGMAMVRHALGLTTRVSDPAKAAEAYAVVLGASASIGLEPWLAAVETLTDDRRILRSRQAFLAARASAVRTLGRAALAPPGSSNRYLESALDRGQAALKESCRRVPERWLDLLLRATMAAAYASIEGRSIDVQLAAIGDWLRLEWPEPSARITLDECLAELVAAAPGQIAALGRRILGPAGAGDARIAAQGLWLSRSLPLLMGLTSRLTRSD